MKYRRLLGTDLEVSELGVGCARLGGLFYRASEADTVALLHTALDAGVTFFDTADMYAQGESERLLGKAFGSCRDRVIIASKVGYMLPPQRKLIDRLKPIARPLVQRLGFSRRLSTPLVRGSLVQDFSPGKISMALEGSLSRLQTDYLDLLMLHGVPNGQWDETIDRLESLKSRGLVRHYGVSCETVDEGYECLDRSEVSAVQIGVSLLHQEAVSFMEESRARGIGIVARQCYASGLLSRPSTQTDFSDQPPERLPGVRSFEAIAEAHGRRLPEVALKFVNSLPGVDVTLVGIRTPVHLRDAITFLEAPPLSEAEMSELTALRSHPSQP